MDTESKSGFHGVLTFGSEYFGLSRAWSLIALGFVALVLAFAGFWFVYSAPPRVLTMTGGLPGSAFESNAVLYRGILASNGVHLNILPSHGSQENLERLREAALRVDIGFVQGGVAKGTDAQNLVSLGSVAYEPLLVFYRGSNLVTRLSQFEGRCLAIGPEGSGTHELALTLLQTNGIVPGGSTTLATLESDAAAAALVAGKVDAVFLMSDSTSRQTLMLLLRAPGVQLMSFEQADAYTRRFNYLNKLRLPEGAIDFSKNLPPHDVWLIGPTVELVARPDLNAALSDLLLDAATQVHGKASLFQSQAEFPAPLLHEFSLSPDALRYYKSGKKWLYRELPYWIASLVNRVLLAFVPIVLVLIPGLRLIPTAYKWRTQLRIYRWYRKLLVLEREVVREQPPAKVEAMLRRLNEIEMVVTHMRVPASFASQFYSLREHIDYVRERLSPRAQPPAADGEK